MDKTLDLDELERVAREATQGEWVSFDRDTASNIYSAGNNGSLLAVCHSYTTDVSEKRPNAARRKANATYIATFDPPTILTLIAAARPAVVSDEVVPAVFDEFNRQFMNHVEAMRAALALLPGGVPDGYMLVPREPTEAMIRSGQGAADDKYWLWRGLGERPVGSGLDGMALYVDAAYRAMLSASPKGTSVAESAAGDASHLTASETPCKSDWSEFEDEISDAISDSMDMDWSSRDGARAVVAYLKQIGAKLS